MTRFFAMILATCLATTATAQVRLPTPEEQALITPVLAAMMLDPASTIVSDVMAAPDKEHGTKLLWVCGQVRGKNGFGGYAQPTPFIGSVVTQDNGNRVFLPIMVADQTNAKKLAVNTTCLQRLQ